MKIVPVSLDPEEDRNNDGGHSMSARQFHNAFYDGFYAPYMSNPEYLLLVDTRDETSFLESHILGAEWHGRLSPGSEPDLSKFTLIILYDQDGSGIRDPESVMSQLQSRWKKARLDPVCIDGQYTFIDVIANLIKSPRN